MISQIKQKGFTIVELLIVIVVIAILAALSYVGYTSITARAKDSTAQASAKAVKDAITTFQGNHGVAPASIAELRTGVPATGATQAAVAKLPADVNVKTTDAVVADNEKTVAIQVCGSDSYRVRYVKYTGSPSVQSMDVGNPGACSSPTYLPAS